MTTLVTGSAGHLGEAIIRLMRAEGRAVRGLDIRPSPFTGCVGSISDRAFVRAALKDARSVIHAATLHKPHVATHGKEDFVATNILGTLVLLEEAAAAKCGAFVFTSTTSAFGSALTPGAGEPAAWITEGVTPVAKNIYGVSKLAAENLCEMFARRERLPVVVLRTSRFFPEPDDDPSVRSRYALENVQANELLYRRGDIADMARAHILALERAAALGFGRFIVSATTPFTRDDLADLRIDAPRAVARRFPAFAERYAAKGWTMFASIDRVYANHAATSALGWSPQYGFAGVLDWLAGGADFRSPLSRHIGLKGYHGRRFADGLYPVAAQSGRDREAT